MKIKHIFYVFYLLLLLIVFDKIFGILFVNQGKIRKDYIVLSDTLNHVWKKNHTQKLNLHEELGEFIFKTNSVGLKNQEINLIKDKNTTRVMLIGDSFTASYDPKKSFKKVLSNKLKHDKNIELINAGVSSYSPVLHYFHYKYLLKKYKPDIIILSIDVTDIRDDYYYSHLFRYENDNSGDPIGVYPIHKKKKIFTIKGMIEKNSIFSKYWTIGVLSKYSNIFSYFIFSPKQNMWFRHWADKDWHPKLKKKNFNYLDFANGVHKKSDEAYNIMFKYLDKLINDIEYDGGEVILSIYPHLELLKENNSYYSSQIKKYAIRNHLEIHDLYEDMINFKDNDQFYLTGDMHFNYEGIKFWATNLAEFLNSKIFVDKN